MPSASQACPGQGHQSLSIWQVTLGFLFASPWMLGRSYLRTNLCPVCRLCRCTGWTACGRSWGRFSGGSRRAEKTSELSRLCALGRPRAWKCRLLQHTLKQPRHWGSPSLKPELNVNELSFSEGSEPFALERLSADVRMSSAGCL